MFKGPRAQLPPDVPSYIQKPAGLGKTRLTSGGGEEKKKKAKKKKKKKKKEESSWIRVLVAHI